MDELTILKNIKKQAASVGRNTTRILLELYYVLKSSDTPLWDKTIILSALSYQFLPKQILSKEKHGILGYTDNLITLMLAYNRVRRRVTPQIAMDVDKILSQWFGYTAIE